MNTNFDFFTLTIFRGCSMEQLTKAVENHPVLQGHINDKIANIYPDILQIENYYNPEYNTLLKFSWWESERYPGTTFLCCNLQDGMSSYSEFFRRSLECEIFRCRMSMDLSPQCYPCNTFSYTSSSGESRNVLTYTEGRWVFYESGNILPFENGEYYKNKYIKNRLNANILIEYITKLGYNFIDIDKNVIRCNTFERTSWR